MRLHHLRFAGIGPFAEPAQIDFDRLGVSGLFLLEGPTGAGKSTIIDAITFALYGQVAADGADKHRLRSDHAAASDESVVELVFSTSSGVYQVRRTPAYERLKQRGEGTTLAQTTAKLWRLNDPEQGATGEAVSTRVEEVNAEIQRLLGLSRGQFVQTVILPQGQFAAFLHSDPEDRREVLQKVFGTELYEAWTEELTRRRLEGQKRVQSARQMVVQAAVRLVEAAGLDPDQAQAVQALIDQPSWLAEDLAELRAQADGAAKSNAQALEQASEQVSQAEAALEQAKDLAGAWGRRTKLESQVAELRAGAAQREVDSKRVAVGRRAALVVRPMELADQATSHLAQAERATQQLGLDQATLGQGAAALQAEVGRAQAALKVATEQLAAARDHQVAQGAADKTAQAMAKLLKQLDEAVHREQAQRQAWIGGMAADLAGQLVLGQPCPVCGSLAHPAPAKPGPAHVTREQVEAAQAARQALEPKLAPARTLAEQAKVKAAELATLSGGLDVPAATAGLKQAKQAAGTASKVAKAVANWETAQVSATAQMKERDKALAEQGFESAPVAREAFIEPSALKRLDDQIRADEARLNTLIEQLAGAEFAQLAGTPQGAQQALASAKARRHSDNTALTDAKTRQAVLAKQAAGIGVAINGLDQTLVKLTGEVDRSAAVTRMANLASGGVGNLVQVTLPTYVLVKRFAEVIDAANARLGPMSAQRYRLEAHQGKEATRARRTGLALQVMDHQTGQGRDPRSLSGGETFYVSLALALGLADVVKSEAGGVDLGTLFIDEGFGSLDDEVLDNVLAELSQLRAGGRMVGVVSHVETMKQAIAERIEVRRTPAGTSTLTLRA